MVGPKEADFESLICDSLVASGGYIESKVGVGQGSPTDFDPAVGLDTAELFTFIGATQPDAWSDLIGRYGGDADAAQRGFISRLSKRLDELGTIEVLRHGVDDLGVDIKLAFFAPATSLNPEAQRLYEANRLTVTRQLPYDPASNKTLDLCLFVNGLPVATAELKTHLTGQTSAHARAQYETTRNPANLTLRRAIVHFAVDTEVAWMTTRLAGKSTRWFHFNQGRNDAAGNPDNPDGVRTAYLWERVWSRDAWLDILGRFVHVEPAPKGKRTEGAVIFPRFHQWDAVMELCAHAARHGAGHNYLVQHSAGSGKSNTIAWLAHRLSNLHSAADLKVFDKVIIITDRRVLDRQLQDTVGQFEKVAGVVRKIDEDSAQLAEALEGEQARIVITTIQKFPFVIDKVAELADRSYAVIADEAHSSQSGETAKDLKLVLSGAGRSDEDVLAGFESEELGDISEVSDPAQDALARQVDARGQQENLSFFAFTATPKARTLELFGTRHGSGDDAEYRPFHLYSMRQAIEEGYIHDVLASYTTYQTYWEIEQTTPDDPEYDPGRAKAAIAKYVSLHEHNLAQKADIIINHFRDKVAHKVGGQAKAMVVTASRLHALRYGLALRRYCGEHGIGVGVLVAFSGTLQDHGIDYTETSLNGFGESQTPERFDSDDYQILVVAEKYQTGFDQPKLHTMYVDKPLSGLAAVQTLSRLNRRHPAKADTFVLDFRNDAGSIREAFAKWYVQTTVPPTDPNLMYDAHRQVHEFDVLRHQEVETFIYVLMDDPKAIDRINATLEGAKGRFWDTLDQDEQERFREDLKKFTSAYGYLAQVVSYGDAKLERDYLFCRALAKFIRKPSAALPDLSDEVELSALATRLQVEDQSISLPSDDGELSGPGEMFGRPGVPEMETLSEIIRLLNERYGTNFDPEDRVFFDGLVDKMAQDPQVQAAAMANDQQNFGLAMRDDFEGAVIDQMDTATEITKNFLDNQDFAADVLRQYMPLLQTKAKIAHQEHCPIGELMASKESDWLEYKSTFHVEAATGVPHKGVETAAIKSVAAFLNSWDGGTLLLGVAENDEGLGVPFGLEGDYAQFRKDGKDDEDQFLRALTDKLTNALGAAAVTNVSARVFTVDGKDMCRIHVKPSGFPVEAKVTIVDKNGQHVKQTNHYVRLPNKTHKFVDNDEWEKFKSSRWPGSGS